MTLIVGVVNKDKLIIGGDCCISYYGRDESLVDANNQKVKKINNYLIAYAGNVSTGQYILNNFNPPKYTDTSIPIKDFIQNVFIYELKKLISLAYNNLPNEQIKFLSISDPKRSCMLIIGINNNLCIIDDVFGVGFASNYVVIGDSIAEAFSILQFLETSETEYVNKQTVKNIINTISKRNTAVGSIVDEDKQILEIQNINNQ